MGEWRLAEAERLARNKARREEHKLLIIEWEKERELTKGKKGEKAGPKPKIQGIEPPLPKPNFQEENHDGDGTNGGGEFDDQNDDNSGSEHDDD
jgi:hypothetical protein